MSEKEDPKVIPDAKPADVERLLRTITATRRQSGLYGADHPNTAKLIEDLTECIDGFVELVGRSTWVFTKDTVIVNDRSYPTSEGLEIYRRLRARGVMAITFVGAPPYEQVCEFLNFLNAKPAEVRRHGGPCAYLRAHGVSRVVATEAVYTGGVEGAPGDEAEVPTEPPSVDRVVGAAIDWLTRQDKDEGEETRLPIGQVMADPDEAAKLIQEAVTKLHVSNRQASQGDLASGVLQDLKDVAAPDPDSWDKITPQVRKAIAKLPKEMRPKSGGFTADFDDFDTSTESVHECLSVQEIESTVLKLMEDQSDDAGIPDIQRLNVNSLFAASSAGLLTNWQEELQAHSLTKTSGNTLVALLTWEDKPSEHSRIARALAALIPKAVESEDQESALEFAEALAKEACRKDSLSWRAVNARAALKTLDLQLLREMVRSALDDGSYRSRESASRLVEAVPELALSLVSLLGEFGDESFGESLKIGLIQCGQSACPALGGLLRSNDLAAREPSLDALLKIGNTGALREISSALREVDGEFAARIIGSLPHIGVHMAAEVCANALSHRHPKVRLAALDALGRMDPGPAIADIARHAGRRAFREQAYMEKLSAIRTLGLKGGKEELPLLRKIAEHRPLLGGSRYELVRAAAWKAVDQIERRVEDSATDEAQAA